MKNKVVSREEWLQARHKLLVQEKAVTKECDRLAQARQDFPWVKVDKNYNFSGEAGDLSLADLFAGRSQLIVYHLMYGADWDVPCPGCSAWADAFNGTTKTFEKADARLIAVSRASTNKIASQKKVRGWEFTWVSSAGSSFNIDFYASTDKIGEESKFVGDEEVTFDRGENHGISVFYKNDQAEIFHTYSCYNRGIETMNGAFGYYDILPKGRAW